jgi:hypothetical protein
MPMKFVIYKQIAQTRIEFVITHISKSLFGTSAYGIRPTYMITFSNINMRKKVFSFTWAHTLEIYVNYLIKADL